MYVLSAQGKKDVVYTGKRSAACETKAEHARSMPFKQELRRWCSRSLFLLGFLSSVQGKQTTGVL